MPCTDRRGAMAHARLLGRARAALRPSDGAKSHVAFRTGLDVEVTEEKKTMAEHEVKATDAASGASARQRANDAIVALAPCIAALEMKVRLSKLGGVLPSLSCGTAGEAHSQRARHHA